MVNNSVFNCSVVDGQGHLGGFQCKALIKRASVNILLHIPMYILTYIEREFFWVGASDWNCWIICCVYIQH